MHLDKMPLHDTFPIVKCLASVNQSHVVGEEEVAFLGVKLERILH